VASDPDQGQTLTYSIVSGNIGNTFQIDSYTGEIIVNNNEILDFETNPSFNLTVMVQDNGEGALDDQATITLNIGDVNEVPEIEAQQFELEENSLFNQQVGMVQASDPDNDQTLTFSILSGNTDNAFIINASSGRLSG